MTIGIVRDFGAGAPVLSPDVAANLLKAEAALRDAGAEIVDVGLPATLEEYRNVTSVINWGESFSIHEQDFLQRRHLMGRALRDKMTAGFTLRAADFLAAQRLRRQLCVSTDAVVRTCDAILTPCTFATAPTFDDQKKLVEFTMHAATSIFNVTGHPALSLPTGFDADGLPTSMQVAGRYFDEATIYRVAHVIECAIGERGRRPSL
jgi:aspartyl-tRNA(Asn)/glutamyl-tRNA(Gln) amidotransferase subunit A